MSIEIQRTEHPYIVRHPGIGNGEPMIKGTRIAVRLIAGYYKRGATVEEIERDYAFLSTAAIYDAISYYLMKILRRGPIWPPPCAVVALMS